MWLQEAQQLHGTLLIEFPYSYLDIHYFGEGNEAEFLESISSSTVYLFINYVHFQCVHARVTHFYMHVESLAVWGKVKDCPLSL